MAERKGREAGTVWRAGRKADWGSATWTDLAAAGLACAGKGDRGANDGGGKAASRVVALLPVGAVEAHGPHLPLATDVIIAEAAARAALPGLCDLGYHPFVLPPLAFTAAPFAAGFPGTLSVRPATVSALVRDLASALASQGAAALVLANAHLDPTHVASLWRATEDHEAASAMPLVFPDITRKPWALRLTPEFRSGACHAGQYETSVVMEASPELVREDVRRSLPACPVSLSKAFRDGARTFGDAGVNIAYCGDPAAATRGEGAETIETLGKIIVDAAATRLGAG